MPKITMQSVPPAAPAPRKVSASGPGRVAGTKPNNVSLSSRIVGLDEGLGEGLTVLLYGRSGTGKTTFWATFPAPILVLICSGGVKPGELRSIDTPENRKRIKKLVLQSSADVTEVVETVAPDFATVVLDHTTGFADLVLSEIIGRRLPAQNSWGLVSQQQYGQLGLQCKETFRSLLSLSSNVVFVAQERSFGGKEEGMDPELVRPTIGAALTPTLTGWLNPACDYVVQTFIRPRSETKVMKMNAPGGKTKDVSTKVRLEGVEYCLRTGPHDVYHTKFRTPRGRELPDAIVDPSYDKLVEVIRGE